MNHNDNAYAAMLLTMALSPNREEYARPCSVQEFCRLEALVQTLGERGLYAFVKLEKLKNITRF